MKILIVDDEALARQRLSSMLVELNVSYQLVGEAANGQEAINICHANEVDLVLMDIRMPGMDGLAAAAELTKLETPPAIIFTTAYDEHALAAFEHSATDYLLKPIRRERLQQALERAQRPTRAQHTDFGANSGKTVARTHICAYLGRELRTIPLDEIIYFQAKQKYVTAYFNGGELLLEEPLKRLEEEFSDGFLRIHRNALVAKNHLTGMKQDPQGKWRIMLESSPAEPEISRRHLPQLRLWLKGK